MRELLSNGYPFSILAHFRLILLPMAEKNSSFERVLMVGRGLFISKVDGEGIVPTLGFQPFNQQDAFPIDSIICAQYAMLFQGKPHFLHDNSE